MLQKIRARDGVELERKLVAFEAREAVGEVIDRVVGRRAANCGRRDFSLQAGNRRRPFRSRRRTSYGLAVLRVDAAAIGIEDEFGIDQIAMIRRSQSTPLESPPSSSAVSARMMSRSGR